MKLFIPLVLLVMPLGRIEADQRLPSVLYSEGRPDWPYWVQADLLIDPDGKVDTDLCHPAFCAFINDLMVDPPRDGCVQSGTGYDGALGEASRSTLVEAATTASQIVVFKVTAVDHGFSYASAGQLFLLESAEAIKGPPLIEPGYHLVFLPVGSFEVADRRICKTDARLAGEPQVGDQIVVLLDDPLTPGSPLIELDRPSDLILVRKGKIVVAPSLRQSLDSTGIARPSTLSEFRSFVASTEGGIK